mgnify:CR=1 FL=1
MSNQPTCTICGGTKCDHERSNDLLAHLLDPGDMSHADIATMLLDMTD